MCDTGTVPTTTADKFVWGSLTKMLTGMQILRQVAAGNVSVDSPIGPLVDGACCARTGGFHPS